MKIMKIMNHDSSYKLELTASLAVLLIGLCLAIASQKVVHDV